MQLENRKALVTGAAGGIGQAIVARLQVEGAMVAASDLDLAASAANVPVLGDLRDTGYADGLANAAHDALGVLDIVGIKPASSPVAP
ncbi:MAG: short chain dehydrogenase, partial [SAR116 cluster bacterium]|nr:short chain dehydrogenase [SAR116 cluster bacterium]